MCLLSMKRFSTPKLEYAKIGKYNIPIFYDL